jgi:hypothetical protein
LTIDPRIAIGGGFNGKGVEPLMKLAFFDADF